MSVESLGEIHEITIIDRNRADNVGSVGRELDSAAIRHNETPNAGRERLTVKGILVNFRPVGESVRDLVTAGNDRNPDIVSLRVGRCAQGNFLS